MKYKLEERYILSEKFKLNEADEVEKDTPIPDGGGLALDIDTIADDPDMGALSDLKKERDELDPASKIIDLSKEDLTTWTASDWEDFVSKAKTHDYKILIKETGTAKPAEKALTRELAISIYFEQVWEDRLGSQYSAFTRLRPATDNEFDYYGFPAKQDLNDTAKLKNNPFALYLLELQKTNVLSQTTKEAYFEIHNGNSENGHSVTNAMLIGDTGFGNRLIIFCADLFKKANNEVNLYLEAQFKAYEKIMESAADNALESFLKIFYVDGTDFKSTNTAATWKLKNIDSVLRALRNIGIDINEKRLIGISELVAKLNKNVTNTMSAAAVLDAFITLITVQSIELGNTLNELLDSYKIKYTVSAVSSKERLKVVKQLQEFKIDKDTMKKAVIEFVKAWNGKTGSGITATIPEDSAK